ncbi:MAG: MBL fold metallo-hydrolase [Actinomycetota bacterium]
MELTVLGAHGTWPGAGGATSGLLVRENDFNIWIDAGSGTVANLQRHIGLFDVGAVMISHSHPDHVSDLYSYLMARLFSPERPPKIPLYLAPNVAERFNPLLTDDSAEMRLAEAFDIVVVDPGQKLELGPFKMTTAEMRHSVPTFGVRLEAGGKTLTYSADTGPTDELVKLGRDADLLVAEASYQEADGKDLPPIHMSARQAGEAAAEAGAGKLVLTHIRPYLDWDRSRDEAAAAFTGETILGRDNETMKVGS